MFFLSKLYEEISFRTEKVTFLGRSDRLWYLTGIPFTKMADTFKV